MNNYEDIINLPHHVSKTRPKMIIENRSAQFAPFSALVGFQEQVKETARLTDKKIEIDEGLRLIINNKLQIIKDKIEDKPEIYITYFISDKRKDGGSNIKIKGIVKKIDEYKQIVELIDKTIIPMVDIINITGEIFDSEEK